jgi:hypothetical protein
VPRPAIRWKLRHKPVFDNVVAGLHIDGPRATATLWRARPTDDGLSSRLDEVYRDAL